MLELRTPRAIASDLLSTPDVPLLHPDHRLPNVEIAGDFVFLDARSADRETRGRDAPLAKLGTDWRVFAESGTGDAWLISVDGGQRIAFLDHAPGPDAEPLALGIDLGQWLQLADLMRQFECIDDPALATHAERLMDRIAEGLSQRYPYRLAG